MNTLSGSEFFWGTKSRSDERVHIGQTVLLFALVGASGTHVHYPILLLLVESGSRQHIVAVGPLLVLVAAGAINDSRARSGGKAEEMESGGGESRGYREIMPSKKDKIMAAKTILLLWLLFPLTTAFGFNPNPKLTALAENTWMILDSTGIQFDGHTAYSGGTYDRTNHQFLIFGGGHWDGWKNDVLAFDIATAKWKSMYTPDPASSYNCGNVNSTTPGMLLNSRMPASRHTWDMIDFIDHLGTMIIWSGATYSGIWECPGNTLPADTWLYDYRTNKWEYKNKARGPQPADEGGKGAYDPIGKLYWSLARDTTYQSELWNYNADTDKWTLVIPKGDIPWGGMMIVDRKRQILHAYPDFYDIKANQWSTMTNTPSGLSGGPYDYVASYDEANDVLVHVSSNGKVFVYDIARNQWETLSPPGTPSIDGDGTWGRFFYDPVDNVHLFVKPVDYRARTWAYRYKGGAL